MIRRSVVVLLALSLLPVACKKKKEAVPGGGSAAGGGGGPAATPTPSAAAADKDCAAAIDAFTKIESSTMLEFIEEMKKNASDDDKAQTAKMEAEFNAAAPKMRAIRLARCTSDKWSVELLKCMREAEAKNAGACEKLFTAEQMQHVKDDMAKAGLGPTSDPVPPAGETSCKGVVDHIEALMMAGSDTPESKETMAPMVEPLILVMREQCGVSKWSAELRACLGAAPELPAMEKCDPLFTPEQKTALEKGLGGTAEKKQQQP